jgi:hypothetical protein
MKEFCLLYEDPSIDEYLLDALKRMFAAVERGLQKEDYLPANANPRLHWKRCAKGIYHSAEANRRSGSETRDAHQRFCLCRG